MEEANRIGVFLVSVAHDCWAYPRLGVRPEASSGSIEGWLYRDPSRPIKRMTQAEGVPAYGRNAVHS